MMKVLHFLICQLESIELFNQIDPYLHEPNVNDNPLVIENESDITELNDNHWTSITVSQCEDKKNRNSNYEEDDDYDIDELILNDYPHVQYIEITDSTLNHVSYLKISNLPNLTELTIGDNSFKVTTKVTLLSIFLLIMN